MPTVAKILRITRQGPSGPQGIQGPAGPMPVYPGPYASAVAALIAGVAPGALYHAPSGALAAATPSAAMVAIVGDSLLAGGGSRTGGAFPGFPNALIQHSNYAIKVLGPDLSRDSTSFAEPGYASVRGPLALDEISANCFPAPTMVMVHYGPNDITNQVPLGTYRANMATIVAKAQAIGAMPVILTICPGDGTTMVNGVLRATLIAQFNTALHADFGARNDVLLIDASSVLEASPGVALPFYSTDGIHLSNNASRIWVRYILSQLAPYLPAAADPFRSVLPVNKDPFLLLGTGGVVVPAGGTLTQAYQARTDGKQYLGERELLVNLDHGNPVIGTTGTNAVVYTRKVAGQEAYVEHYADASANAVLSVEMRSCNTLRVYLRRNANFQILSTPAEVAAAVNGYGASPYTAAASGSGVCAYGKMTPAQFWTAIEAGDEPLSMGDVIRCVFQVRKVAGQALKLREAGAYVYLAQGGGPGIFANSNSFSELYTPLLDGETLTYISPWTPVRTVDAATQLAQTPAVFVSWHGHGQMLISRVAVQKKALPLLEA